ncbi:MAG: 4Fe-4S binding protein, partial [Candidatus Aegiribacteria sp.]|nr:4Fe-4S binding protein [Candidatus Aegiribacteria sp.]
LYFQGLIQGAIFTGKSKIFCVPGLHCYSCPSSVLSCPVGTVQNILSSEGFTGGLATGRPDAIILLGVIGFLLTFGFIAGRFACGWICPFCLLQGLLYRIPSPKIRIPASWRDAKYAVLLIFVFLLPLTLRTVPGAGGDPWFCKAICPSGTLTAGIPLVLHDSGETFQTGFLFSWKIVLLILVLLWSITSKRPFCRVLCPLGAFWGLAGKVSIFRMRVDPSCIRCDKCRSVCPVDIAIYREPNSAECIRCGKCIDVCPVHAIHHDMRKRVGS